MNEPKITVIIPTRERCDVLGKSLKAVTNQDYDNLEIIVSDNCSYDCTAEVVRSANDKRVRYINTGRRLSMSHNWEFALSHVDNGWVTFQGDDDGLLPGAIKLLSNIITDFPCEAVSSSFCTYFWPNNGWTADASLAVPTAREGIKYLDSKAELASVMTGRKTYKRLPMLYSGGFATIEAINRARHKKGYFFMSMIPDVYSGIALASVTEKFLRIGTPLAVAGASRHSGGLSSVKPDNKNSWNKFVSEKNIPFHPNLVFGKAFHLLVYECYLQSYFLHHDFLALNLKDQLELAIADNGLEDREVIRDQCERIAELNGIKFSRTSLSGFTRLINMSFIRQVKRFANVPRRKLLLGEDAAGQNVFEASLKASEVISQADSKSTLANSFQNIWRELKPRAITRRLKLIRKK